MFPAVSVVVACTLSALSGCLFPAAERRLFLSVTIGLSRLLASPVPSPAHVRQKGNGESLRVIPRVLRSLLAYLLLAICLCLLCFTDNVQGFYMDLLSYLPCVLSDLFTKHSLSAIMTLAVLPAVDMWLMYQASLHGMHTLNRLSSVDRFVQTLSLF